MTKTREAWSRNTRARLEQSLLPVLFRNEVVVDFEVAAKSPKPACTEVSNYQDYYNENNSVDIYLDISALGRNCVATQPNPTTPVCSVKSD